MEIAKNYIGDKNFHFLTAVLRMHVYIIKPYQSVGKIVFTPRLVI